MFFIKMVDFWLDSLCMCVIEHAWTLAWISKLFSVVMSKRTCRVLTERGLHKTCVFGGFSALWVLHSDQVSSGLYFYCLIDFALKRRAWFCFYSSSVLSFCSSPLQSSSSSLTVHPTSDEVLIIRVKCCHGRERVHWCGITLIQVQGNIRLDANIV